MTVDTNHFKDLLEKERQALIEELQNIGARNPSNPTDWVGKAAALDTERSDKNDVADNIEELETHNAVVMQLEIRLNNIKNALKRIEEGTFGTCEICNKAIEENRLEVNPSARTCITDRDREGQLDA